MSMRKLLKQYGLLRSSGEQVPPRSFAAYYQDFYASFAKQNYGDAYACFVAALSTNADLAYRYFMTRSSRAVTQMLEATGKTREVVARLEELIARFPNINILCHENPSEVDRVRRLRELNIERGLPSIAVVAQGKSASVSIGNIFSWGFDLPSLVYSIATLEVVESWAHDFARGGACYTTHLHPLERNIARLKRAGVRKIIVHVRDPRQGILSGIHHIMRYDDSSLHLKQNGFAERAIDEQLEDVMALYARRILWLQGWLEAEHELDILFSTFEDFVQNREAFVARYLDYYGGPTEYFRPDLALTIREGTDYHYRAGEIDEWKRVFSGPRRARLSDLLPTSIKRRFNWPD
jgi:Sulfotransferase domain